MVFIVKFLLFFGTPSYNKHQFNKILDKSILYKSPRLWFDQTRVLLYLNVKMEDLLIVLYHRRQFQQRRRGEETRGSVVDQLLVGSNHLGTVGSDTAATGLVGAAHRSQLVALAALLDLATVSGVKTDVKSVALRVLKRNKGDNS